MQGFIFLELSGILRWRQILFCYFFDRTGRIDLGLREMHLLEDFLWILLRTKKLNYRSSWMVVQAGQISLVLLAKSYIGWKSCRGLRLRSLLHTSRRNNQEAYRFQRFIPLSKKCPLHWALCECGTSRSWILRYSQLLDCAKCRKPRCVQEIVWPLWYRMDLLGWFYLGLFSFNRSKGLDTFGFFRTQVQSA